ncbi:MAG: thiamine phosphate synthase, partial [Gammaproteobacteria bacterium]|nr:thiamine phosphate synthase [Gammaproteobacteria bacterium]
ITREQDADEALALTVRQALQGGASVVQLRDKSPDHRARRAELLLGICHQHGVPLIINDDIALTGRLEADGVHLGRDDDSIAAARAALPPGTIIGVSCYDSVERAEEAEAEGADYVAFGRFFPSRTKPHAPRASVDTLRAACRRLTVPIVAIGGITAGNAASLVEAGAGLLAVVDAVFGEDEPERAARRFRPLFSG